MADDDVFTMDDGWKYLGSTVGWVRIAPGPIVATKGIPKGGVKPMDTETLEDILEKVRREVVGLPTEGVERETNLRYHKRWEVNIDGADYTVNVEAS